MENQWTTSARRGTVSTAALAGVVGQPVAKMACLRTLAEIKPNGQPSEEVALS